MNIQIKLNDKNPDEARLITYLNSIGPRSGVPKRMLISSFLSSPVESKVKDKEKKPKKMDISSMAGV